MPDMNISRHCNLETGPIQGLGAKFFFHLNTWTEPVPIQPGPPQHLRPGPIQVLFRSWPGINSQSKHFVSVQGRINIYF